MKNPLYFDLNSERREPNTSLKRAKIFKKYFPKYLKQFSYSFRDGSVSSKLKRVKIIESFSTFHDLSSSQDWRVLLGNKTKSVKTIYNNSNPLQFSEKIKIFSGLQSIVISVPHSQDKELLKNVDLFLKRACKSIKRLRQLESLEVDRLSQTCTNFLRMLDSSPKVISSLKKFNVSCTKEASIDPQFLEMILKNKNLIQYITKFQLGVLCSNEHFQNFILLTNACPNLSSLDFEFSHRNATLNLYGARRFCFADSEVNTDYLQAIRNFQKLRLLNLDIADTFTFFKDLALPPSIQNLRLNFEEYLSKQILSKIYPDFIKLSNSEIKKFFEEDETLLKFYSNFQQLGDLITLELVESLDSDPDSHQYHTYLAQNLIKRISSVQKISFQYALGIPSLFQSFGNFKQDASLVSIFESFSHLGESLQSLEIGHEEIVFSQIDLSAFQGKFVNLSSVDIKGRFYEFERGSDKIGPLLRHIGSLGENIKTIKLSTFAVGFIGSLLTLLRQVNRLKNPSNAKIELEIQFFDNQNLEDLKEGFAGPINDLKTGRGYQKAKRVSLKLFTDINSKNMSEFLEVYGEKFEDFSVISRYNRFRF